MSEAAVTRTKEELLLLAACVAGIAIAGVSAREAVMIDIGPILGTAAALGVAGASAFAYWLSRAARGVVVRGEDAELTAARELLSAIPDGLMLVQDGRVRSVNRRLCELLGFERAELVGEGQPFSFWPPELRHELEAWHEDLERRGELEGELTLRRRQSDSVSGQQSSQTQHELGAYSVCSQVSRCLTGTICRPRRRSTVWPDPTLSGGFR